MKGQRGFTLIEVLVALAVGSIVVLTTTLALRAVSSSQVQADAALSADRTARVLLARFATELRSAAVSQDCPFAGQSQRLAFCSTAPARRDRLTPYLYEFGGTPARLQWKSGRGASEVSDWVDGLRQVRFRYLVAGSWREELHAVSAPAAVEISIEAADGQPWRTSVDLLSGSGGVYAQP